MFSGGIEKASVIKWVKKTQKQRNLSGQYILVYELNMGIYRTAKHL